MSNCLEVKIPTFVEKHKRRAPLLLYVYDF